MKRGRFTSMEPEPVADDPLDEVVVPEPTVKKATPKTICKFCGADPPMPTRDGLHKCQCRRERT